ncbi:histidine kinase [Aureisphaera galaxeae]|uniref:sensor histidine kinase n=1 Tax=Aureisphaera galaxeae TaxID=1538023 RepID=UPI002350156D|nr:histidine kinase [Aureisphaera galaxeae]MDC8003610.1 histidine kinase [Aureisphaera galaxeae]
MGSLDSFFQEKSFVTLIAIGILIMLAFALAFILYANHSQKKILKQQMHHQELAYQHQEDLLHSTILTQESERKRIARDLHDEIGSKLNVIFLNICRLREHNISDDEMGTITDEVESVINTTIDSIRLISHELLPPTLEEFGLVEAIRELQYGFNKMDGVYIHFAPTVTENLIEDKIIELNLFRVLQELINNSIRHGKASEITIQLSPDPAIIKLEYRDNGEGFEMDKFEHKKGLGMKNIESRLHMIHAQYKIDSLLGQGVTMEIEVPNTPNENMKFS